MKTKLKTRKIVKNSCWGGFGLSAAAIKRYLELKGKPCYFFTHSLRTAPIRQLSLEECTEELLYSVYTTCNLKKLQKVKESEDNWLKLRMDEKDKINRSHEKLGSFYHRDIPRDDPDLIRVVEELGNLANGFCAKLVIVEIPAGIKWEISDYDGMETVHEIHKSW